MGSVQLYTAKPLLDGLGGSPAIDPNCCCVGAPPKIAINVCNFNKWSDSIHDVWLNDPTLSVAAKKLTRPSVHVDGACGGGYYTNAVPAPDYCTLGFSCCGKGGYTQIYPAEGCANEDPLWEYKYSEIQTCGTYGDCGGDLVNASFSDDIVNFGINTVYMSQPKNVPIRPNGSYGILQICKLMQVSGIWVRYPFGPGIGGNGIVTNLYGDEVVPSFISVSI